MLRTFVHFWWFHGSSSVQVHVAEKSFVHVGCILDLSFLFSELLYLQLYMLFGVLWVSNYIIALGECTIAGSFASYYWAWNKSKDIGLFTTPSSFARAILWVFQMLVVCFKQSWIIRLNTFQSKLYLYLHSKSVFHVARIEMTEPAIQHSIALNAAYIEQWSLDRIKLAPLVISIKCIGLDKQHFWSFLINWWPILATMWNWYQCLISI